MDNKENYTTIFHNKKAIPMSAVKDSNANRIGMDTHPQREGLHLWISKWREPTEEEKKNLEIKNNEKIRESLSIHLTREDAHNLIKEINARLF